MNTPLRIWMTSDPLFPVHIEVYRKNISLTANLPFLWDIAVTNSIMYMFSEPDILIESIRLNRPYLKPQVVKE